MAAFRAERPDQRLARVGQRLVALQLREDIGQRRGAVVRHADGVQRPDGVGRVDRHDVRVLEPGQRARLARQLGRDLQGHRPVGQLALGRQVDAAEGPAAQLVDQAEAEEIHPGSGQARDGPRELLGAGRVGVVQAPEELRRPVGDPGRPAPVVDVGPARTVPEAELQVRPRRRLDVDRPQRGARHRARPGVPVDRHLDGVVRLEPVGPVEGVEAEPALVFLLRDLLAGHAAEPVFLERQLLDGLAVLGQLGIAREVVAERPDVSRLASERHRRPDQLAEDACGRSGSPGPGRKSPGSARPSRAQAISKALTKRDTPARGRSIVDGIGTGPHPLGRARSRRAPAPSIGPSRPATPPRARPPSTRAMPGGITLAPRDFVAYLRPVDAMRPPHHPPGVTASPPAGVPRALRTFGATDSLTKWTEPSTMRRFAPPL